MVRWSKRDRSGLRERCPDFFSQRSFGALLGLFLWFVGVQGASRPEHGGSSATPTASAPSILTRACTPQEMAFNGAITDCALPVGPIGTCTVNGVTTPCSAPSGGPSGCSAPVSSPPDSFSISLTLRGATKSIYELYLAVTHGYHGDGTYLVTPRPGTAASMTVPASINHQFWTATSGTETITAAGKSGTASAVLEANCGHQVSASPQMFLLDGPWLCG